MPHVDEKMLGVTTVAAAGLFAAIMLQPVVEAATAASACEHASTALVAVAGVPLRAIAAKIQAWREMRERASADRDVLANMSDRELQDIGLDRARANAIANGAWMHERC